jgi:hypothetical protein
MADLTSEELVVYLDAKIRQLAKWKLHKDDDDDFGTLSADRATEKIAKVAAIIYDDIVTDFQYDETLLKATRSVNKFNVAYVARIIKKAMKDGLVEESKQASVVADSLEEYFKDKKIIRK